MLYTMNRWAVHTMLRTHTQNQSQSQRGLFQRGCQILFNIPALDQAPCPAINHRCSVLRIVKAGLELTCLVRRAAFPIRSSSSWTPHARGFKQRSVISASQARFRNMWSFMWILLLKRKRARPSSLACLAISWNIFKYFKPCPAISLAFAEGIQSGARYIFRKQRSISTVAFALLEGWRKCGKTNP